MPLSDLDKLPFEEKQKILQGLSRAKVAFQYRAVSAFLNEGSNNAYLTPNPPRNQADKQGKE